MAIDFSQVKTITIPEGSVKKITDSTGAVLWNKGPSWRTVWAGNKKIGYGGQTSRFVFAKEPYSDALKIRVSFSSMTAYPALSGDDYSVSYIPSNHISPVTYESFSSYQTELVKAYIRNSSRQAYYSACLYYNKGTGEIYGVASGTENYARSYIVITKIEIL